MFRVQMRVGSGLTVTLHSAFSTSPCGLSFPLCPSSPNSLRHYHLRRSQMKGQRTFIDLGEGSDILYCPEFLDANEANHWLNLLDKNIPWVRPTLFVYGRPCEQPRETCYVADEGLPQYKYSSYTPVVHKWDDFPALKSISDLVHKALPGYIFNSVLLNRYANGTDYAAWHSDDEKVYGPTPTIASITLGKEREFLIRKKKNRKLSQKTGLWSSLNTRLKSKADMEHTVGLRRQTKGRAAVDAFDILLGKRKVGLYELGDIKDTGSVSMQEVRRTHAKSPKDRYSFMLKHGSLLVMKGYTQRDWEHSVPKRKRVDGLRINLTFRYICS